MIERFNGRIADVLATTRFDFAEHLTDTIKGAKSHSTFSSHEKLVLKTAQPLQKTCL